MIGTSKDLDILDHRSSMLSAVSEDDGGDGSTSKISTDTGGQSNHPEGQTEIEIAKLETHWVRCSKALVYVVLMLAAAGSGIATYKFVKKGEIHDFNKAVSFFLKGRSAIRKKLYAETPSICVFAARLRIMPTKLFKFLRSLPRIRST